MQQTEIYGKLSDIFRELFDDPDLVLRPDLTADDVDGWDSLYHVRLVLTVQETFNIKFSALEITNLQNVGDLVELIENKGNK